MPGLERHDLRFPTRMQGFHFGTKPLCRRAQRIVREMSISLGCQRIRMAEQPADDLKAETAGNEVRGMGVAVVVKAVVLKVRLIGNIAPELFNAL